jgi:dihydrofolate reductase
LDFPTRHDKAPAKLVGALSLSLPHDNLIPMHQKRKVFVYIATSLDGYIAEPNDGMAFLDVATDGDQDYCYHDFISGIDTVILGRKTFDWVMTQVPENPHKERTTYVISRTARPSAGNLHYRSDIPALVAELRTQPGKHIFVDGGAEVVHTCLQAGLVDELIISVMPVLLGDGVQLWRDGRPTLTLKLVSAIPYPKGVVKLHYVRDDGANS